MPNNQVSSSFNNQGCKLLHGIKLISVNPSDITVLIGADAPEALLPLEVKRGKKEEPLAIRTIFGWTFFGSNNLQNKEVSINLTTINNDETMHQVVEKFWQCESYPLNLEKDVALSREDKRCLLNLDINTTLENDRYSVPMLWKSDSTILPNNRCVAEKRFNSLQHRLRNNPELAKKYK